MFKFFRKKSLVIIKYDKENIPNFKYHKDPLNTGAFIENKDGKRCNCCNMISKYIYLEPYYSIQEISCLCPDCISNGEAHLKFDMEFQDPESCESVSNKSIIEEVCYRTPGYCSWQQENWLSCCDDLCEYIGCLKWDKVKELGIENEITEAIIKNESFIAIGRPIEELIDAVNDGEHDLCVFQCLHCKKYKVDISLS